MTEAATLDGTQPSNPAGGDPAAVLTVVDGKVPKATTEKHDDAEGLGGGSEAVAAGIGDGATSGGDPSTQQSIWNLAAPASSMPNTDLGLGPFSLDDFDTGVTLGTGSFGRVRIATHKTTQTPWAIKILKKAEIIRMQQVRTVDKDTFEVLSIAIACGFTNTSTEHVGQWTADF